MPKPLPMKFFKKDNWRLSFSQRISIFLVLIVLILIELFFNVTHRTENAKLSENELAKIEKLENDLAGLITEYQYNNKFVAPQNFKINDSIKPFNPNKLKQKDWENLGFTTKQAEVILKYKNILGGKFESKEQLKKCFVISDEVYQTLAPYILLPERSKADEKAVKEQLTKKVNYKKFNPNQYSKKDWINIGFTDRQAESILKYKDIVGGNFKSKEQLKKCYVIAEEKFAEMAPYIVLPEKSEPSTFQKTIEEKEQIVTESKPQSKAELTEKFNPNNLDVEGWRNLGFSDRQIQTIFNYKKSLGGKFKDAKILKKCYAISEEKFQELEPFLVFD